MHDIQRLALALHDIEAVKFGRFQLASGKISPIYVDLRLLISAPTVLKMAAEAYAEILNGLEYDLLGAIPYGGMPIGTAVSLETGMPMIFPRKAVKSYGTGKRVEGKWQVGQTVVIIEDLVTTGGSALNGLAMLKAEGLHCSDIVVLLDRMQGGAQNVTDAGYQLHSVMRMDRLLVILEENRRITGKQHLETLTALGI